jgi:hypothetical protein
MVLTGQTYLELSLPLHHSSGSSLQLKVKEGKFTFKRKKTSQVFKSCEVSPFLHPWVGPMKDGFQIRYNNQEAAQRFHWCAISSTPVKIWGA